MQQKRNFWLWCLPDSIFSPKSHNNVFFVLSLFLFYQLRLIGAYFSYAWLLTASRRWFDANRQSRLRVKYLDDFQVSHPLIANWPPRSVNMERARIWNALPPGIWKMVRRFQIQWEKLMATYGIIKIWKWRKLRKRYWNWYLCYPLHPWLAWLYHMLFPSQAKTRWGLHQ